MNVALLPLLPVLVCLSYLIFLSPLSFCLPCLSVSIPFCLSYLFLLESVPVWLTFPPRSLSIPVFVCLSLTSLFFSVPVCCSYLPIKDSFFFTSVLCPSSLLQPPQIFLFFFPSAPMSVYASLSLSISVPFSPCLLLSPAYQPLPLNVAPCMSVLCFCLF